MRIALVAGEASGDLLGAGLVEALRRRFPAAEFAGVAGPRMRAAGVEAWHDAAELSVMGLAEVLRHLPRLLRLRRSLRARVLDWQPDVFIGIDAPDFNLGLETSLKQAGIRTVHYVSPSVWAWREGRAAKLGRSADLVLCLFPMEPAIYERHGVAAAFVGHPLAEAFEAIRWPRPSRRSPTRSRRARTWACPPRRACWPCCRAAAAARSAACCPPSWRPQRSSRKPCPACRCWYRRPTRVAAR
jgi:lipid-A-disaccharide synthase